MIDATDFSFYTHAEYIVHFAESISRAKSGDRIALASMSFDPKEHHIATLMSALERAAKNNAEVYLAVDAHTFLMGNNKLAPGPLWFNTDITRTLPRSYTSTYSTLQVLQDAGVRVTITNIPTHPFSVIPKGRSHIKTAVLNNTLYVGGCNLSDTERFDVMVSWNDKMSADWAYETVRLMVEAGSSQKAFGYKDTVVQIDKNLTLLRDSGKPNQSVILASALKLIDTAEKSILITCQFFPGGVTGRHLLMAHKRGVKVKVLFSHPNAHGGLYGFAHTLNQASERIKLPAEFFRYRLDKSAPLFHAKIIASEKASMVGSHNYVNAGVQLGTAEIALQSSDKSFTKDLLANIENQILKK